MINKRSVDSYHKAHRFSNESYSELNEKVTTLKLALKLKYASVIAYELDRFNRAISIENNSIKADYVVDLIYNEILRSLDNYEYNSYFNMVGFIGIDEIELYQGYSRLYHDNIEDQKEDEVFYKEIDILTINILSSYIYSLPFNEQNDKRAKHSYLDKFVEIRDFCKENYKEVSSDFDPISYGSHFHSGINTPPHTHNHGSPQYVINNGLGSTLGNTLVNAPSSNGSIITQKAVYNTSRKRKP